MMTSMILSMYPRLNLGLLIFLIVGLHFPASAGSLSQDTSSPFHGHPRMTPEVQRAFENPECQQYVDILKIYKQRFHEANPDNFYVRNNAAMAYKSMNQLVTEKVFQTIVQNSDSNLEDGYSIWFPFLYEEDAEVQMWEQIQHRKGFNELVQVSEKLIGLINTLPYTPEGSLERQNLQKEIATSQAWIRAQALKIRNQPEIPGITPSVGRFGIWHSFSTIRVCHSVWKSQKH